MGVHPCAPRSPLISLALPPHQLLCHNLPPLGFFCVAGLQTEYNSLVCCFPSFLDSSFKTVLTRLGGDILTSEAKDCSDGSLTSRKLYSITPLSKRILDIMAEPT